MSKHSLADRISTILTAAPATNLDPESEHQDPNPLTQPPALHEDPTDPDLEPSSIRKTNLQILSDLDTKYSGTKSSRNKIFQQDDTGSEGSHDDNNSYYSDDDSSQGDVDGSRGDVDSSQGDVDSSQDDVDSSQGDEGCGEGVGDEGFANFKKLDVSSERRKGLHVQNQLKIWENLLEMRIQLQKSLGASNRMPQGDSYQNLCEFPEFKKSFAETKTSLVGALGKLLELQDVFTARIKDEEEILSDEDEVEAPIKKKMRKEGDFEKDIAESFANFKGYRDKTVQKWNEKTSLGQKRSGTDVSILKQIEFNLGNMEKLVEKSRIKRSDFAILGLEPQETTNCNIYDDSDFYHQLLRELIEVKSADLTDPVQLGRQWIQLQNLRSKMKRKIDTKATKGRKIRYAIHAKLVNFMAPIDRQLWTEEAKNELYNSLFGKKQISTL